MRTAGKTLGATAVAVFLAAAGGLAWLQWAAPGANPVVVPLPPVAPPKPAPPPPSVPAPAPVRPPAPPASPPAAAAPPPESAPPPSEPPSASGAIVLVPAPDPELVEKSPDGPLPIVARDGRKPWIVYARPFDRSDKRPRIAIVISGLGLSKIATQDAIRDLPPNVTLSFLPYSGNAADWLAQARTVGHETLMDMPMEPLDYPRQDPGPRALLTSLEPRQNLDRLHWMMSRGTGYIGLMTFMGSRFSATPDLLRPILVDIKARGLAFVDSHSGGENGAIKMATDLKEPRGVADRILDAEASRGAIEQHLTELEDLARRGSSSIGVGSAYPVTIQTVAAWAAGLQARGFALAPVSAVLTP